MFRKAKAEPRYDVGVFGVWYGQNYGSVATYYALHNILTSMGKSVLMIDKPLVARNDPELEMTHARRFARGRYQISKNYRIEDLGELNRFCDAFLIGSDQLWNYGISRGTGKTFYLGFVEDDKKKIAYATSFGHASDFAPSAERPKIARFMARFDGISLREDDGVRICRDAYGIRAVQTLDPVFVAEPQIYQELIRKSKKGCKEPYLLTYILDPTPEKREAILHTARELGNLKIINILDGVPASYEKNKKMMDLPDCLDNIQVEDWLKYFSEAQYVITDSFHGVSFSLIFKKNFLAIANQNRGLSRFQSLGRLFRVQNHIVTDPRIVLSDSSYLLPVNYEMVDRILQQERKRSYTWLQTVLDGKKKSTSQLIDENVIGTVLKKTGGKTASGMLRRSLCTGCSACMAVCPAEAVSLKPDEWGFYRSSVDYDKCIECGNCAEICPALHPRKGDPKYVPATYEFVSSNPELVRKSSSGGVFGTLARQILAEKGLVAGAAWQEDLSVAHILIDAEEELTKLQKSKYLQSYMGDIFRQVKEQLDAGRKVLFTGTPCQVSGLRAFMGAIEYDNLITVDIFCSHAPSAWFFRKYLDDSFQRVAEYEFRYKAEGIPWDCNHIRAGMPDGMDLFRNGPRDDYYQRAFHSRLMCPEQCENCHYQRRPRRGDLSIGDFWGIRKRDPQLDVSKGVSVILCNTEKGRAFLESIPADLCAVRKEVPFSWVGTNGVSWNRGKKYIHPQRDVFYEEIKKRPFGEALYYTLKPNHGIYRDVYKESPTALQFDACMRHFRVESDVWEEFSIEGRPTLIVKENKWKENGHYARLALAGMLKKGKPYKLAVKFKIQSSAPFLSFHIIDSGSKLMQVIHRENITGRNQGNQWIELKDVFIPDTDFYDEVMIGAAQVAGPNNYLTFAYIHIAEVQESKPEAAQMNEDSFRQENR